MKRPIGLMLVAAMFVLVLVLVRVEVVGRPSAVSAEPLCWDGEKWVAGYCWDGEAAYWREQLQATTMIAVENCGKPYYGTYCR